MDNFIYSVPNYKFDWSKYIYPIQYNINPKIELFNFLNITEPPLPSSINSTTSTTSTSSNTLNLNNPNNKISKFSKTVRSKHYD